MDKTLELKTQLNKFIFDILSSDNFKQSISALMKNKIKNTILSRKEEFFKAEAYINIREKIRNSIIASLRNQNFKEEIYKFIDGNLKALENSNSTLNTIIPPAFVNGIKVYIYNNSNEIAASFKKLISSENVEKKINDEILKTLNSINPMISRFINADTIHTKIMNGINEYLDNSKNITDIINMINTMLDNVMKKKISEFAVYFPAESKKSLIDSISSSVLDKILSEKFIDMTIDKVEEKFKHELYLLNENSENLTYIIDKLTDSFMDANYSKLLEGDNSKELINDFSNNIINNLLERPLKDFI